MERQTITGSLSTSGRLSGALSVGGGTTDYNELENKPSINGVELSGNKTTQELGIQTTVNVEYDTPFDTGKRLNGKIVYGYYNKSTPISRANWNDCVRILTGLPVNIELIMWDIKYIAGVYWQKGESGDSLYLAKGTDEWQVTCYYTYRVNGAIIYTYVEFVYSD